MIWTREPKLQIWKRGVKKKNCPRKLKDERRQTVHRRLKGFADFYKLGNSQVLHKQ